MSDGKKYAACPEALQNFGRFSCRNGLLQDFNKNPGGQRRAKKSEYAMQMTEKQKVKFVYGMQERQFRSYYEKASRQKAIPVRCC